MKNLLLVSFLLFALNGLAQQNNLPGYQIAGYQYGDTVAIAKLIDLKELVIDNSGYEIASFELEFINQEGFYESYKSGSATLTKTQKFKIKKLKPGQEIYFTNLMVKTKKGTMVVYPDFKLIVK